jgi:hypothetical protein
MQCSSLNQHLYRKNGASLGDPKRSISVVRFMGTLIELMYICLCAVYLRQ